MGRRAPCLTLLTHTLPAVKSPRLTRIQPAAMATPTAAPSARGWPLSLWVAAHGGRPSVASLCRLSPSYWMPGF